jgi:adhesin/invasin
MPEKRKECPPDYLPKQVAPDFRKLFRVWVMMFSLIVGLSAFGAGTHHNTPHYPNSNLGGVPDVTNPGTNLVITVNSSVADGTAKNTIEAHIVDASGNPVANQDVAFVVSGSTSGYVIQTDANGNAFLELSSYTIGTVTVTAKVNGASIIFGSPAVVFFVAGPPNVGAPTTVLTVVTNNATANGVATNSVNAHITDAYGNPVANQTVSFAIASGTGSFVGSAMVTTNANGDAQISLTSLVAGTVNITATVNGNSITNGSPASVIFVAGPPSVGAPTTLLTVVTNNATANGVATNSVNAHITDANGNPVANQTVTFTIASGTGSFVGSATVTTNASGDAQISLTSQVAGTVNITATVNGNNITNGSPASVIFVAGTPSATAPTTILTVVTNNAVADGVATNSVNAHITDANGNPVANQTVSFAIASGTGSFVGAATVTTNANGDAQISLTSLVAGTVNITATVNGNSITNGSPAIVIFVAGAPSATAPTTILTVVTNNAVADGVATNSVNAHITDANGNPVANQTVSFAIASGTGSFVGSATVTTNSSGDAQISLTSLVAGTVNITATVNGNSITNGSPAIVIFVAGAPSATAPTTILTVVTNNAVADGVVTNSVNAHITDANGNPVANQTVTFAIASGTGSFVGSATVTTNANGDALISLTSLVAGPVNITASVNGNSITNGSPAIVIFVAGGPSVGVVTTLLSVITNNAIADGVATNSVNAHITDVNGNPVANQTVTFAIVTGTGSFVGSATITTNANGDAQISLTSLLPGIVTITATVNGVSITNGSPAAVLFVVGPPSVTAPTTILTVVTNNAVADGVATNSVNAHITDANGNPVANQAVTFTMASGSASFVGTTTVATDANGNALITLTSLVAGNNNVTASVNGNSITNGSPAVVIFVAGGPSTSTSSTFLAVVTNDALANGSATNSVKAHVTDANGNPIANQTVTFTIASGNASFIGPTTISTDANGDAVISLTSTVAGTVDVTATINGNSITNGSPAILTFTASPDTSDPLTALIVVTTDAFADGVATNSVKAHVVDANGNPLSGWTVTFTIAGGTASFTGSASVNTDANGDAVIDLASKTAGLVSITATVNGSPITNGSPAVVRFVLENIYVPKIFTPNGDGVNDLLKPILVGIPVFHYFSVYNRWGNLVFTTNDAGAGWDGRFKGVEQPNETYLWIAEGLGTQGNRVLRKGMVSLVR